MATARNPQLQMDIDLNLEKYIKDLNNLGAITRVETKKTLSAVANIEKVAEAKREAANKAHQQKLSQMVEREAKRREIAEERARQRILAGHTTWSQKMVKGINSIGTAVKGMIAVYASAKFAQLIRESVQYASVLADQADVLGISVKQYYALQKAAGDANVPVEKMVGILTKLAQTAQSPEASQKTVLDSLGINTEGMNSIQLMNVLLDKYVKRQVTVGQLAEIVGARQANALALLTTSITSVDNAVEKYNTDMVSRKNIERADKFATAWSNAFNDIKLAINNFLMGTQDNYFLQMLLSGGDYAYVKGIGKYANENLGFRSLAIQQAYEQQLAAQSALGGMQGPNAPQSWLEQTKGLDDLIKKERESAEVKAFQTSEIIKLAEANRYNAEALMFYLGLLEKVNQQEANRTAERLFGATPVTGMAFPAKGIPTSVSAGRPLPAYVPPEGSLVATQKLVQQQIALNATNAQTAEWLRELRVQYAGNADAIAAINELLGETAQRQGMTWQDAARLAGQYLGQLQELAGALQELASVHVQNELMALDIVQERERARWQARSDELRAAGLETSALYRNELRAYQNAAKEVARQETALKSRSFDAEKEGRLVSVVMSTAQAIIQAWATLGPIFGPIGAALAAATGAVQYAAVSAQQNPYRGYREGGWVQGDDSRDNIVFRGSSGEFVSTRDSARRNADALQYGNSGGTIGRGQTININIGTVIGTDEWVQDTLFPGIKKALRQGHSFQPAAR